MLVKKLDRSKQCLQTHLAGKEGAKDDCNPTASSSWKSVEELTVVIAETLAHDRLGGIRPVVEVASNHPAEQ